LTAPFSVFIKVPLHCYVFRRYKFFPINNPYCFGYILSVCLRFLSPLPFFLPVAFITFHSDSCSPFFLLCFPSLFRSRSYFALPSVFPTLALSFLFLLPHSLSSNTCIILYHFRPSCVFPPYTFQIFYHTLLVPILLMFHLFPILALFYLCCTSKFSPVYPVVIPFCCLLYFQLVLIISDLLLCSIAYRMYFPIFVCPVAFLSSFSVFYRYSFFLFVFCNIMLLYFFNNVFSCCLAATTPFILRLTVCRSSGLNLAFSLLVDMYDWNSSMHHPATMNYR
jgi:hypothetical protein